MSGSAVTDIYLVRHGETDWNRAQRLQGTIDTPLNRIGVAQAHQLAHWFRVLPMSVVVTSPLTRARRTAVVVARRRHSAVVIDPRLIEIDHGSWAGLTIPTIAHTFPDAVVDGQLQCEALTASGGETLGAAYRRASTVLQQLVTAPQAAPIVVVSHGVINALLICAAVGNIAANLHQYAQPNGCTYRLGFRRRALVTIECHPLVAPVSGPERWSPSWRVTG